MKISVIGLGYVGLTTAIGLSSLGHKVIGIDINEERIAKIKLGINPLENIKDMGNYLKKYPFECFLGQHKKAIMNSDISFVCIETPPKKNGNLNLVPLKKFSIQLGKILKEKNYHIIVIRSTIFPGSLEILKKILEKYSLKECGKDFDLLVNPEFLREKTAMQDFFHPTNIVIGSENKEVGEKVLECYNKIDAQKDIVSIGVGQIIKYINNPWHANKVSFTNEVGRICEKLKIDGDEVMKIFCRDTQLNISPYYHKIGSHWAGNCLPKDVSVLQFRARKLKVDCPLIQSISKSNDIQKQKINLQEVKNGKHNKL